MTFLPFKFTLATTNFAILFLLLIILIKHTSYKFDIRSWSAGFNVLCVLWLSFRGAFWVLTMCDINYWIGSTFYILYWVPTPISFGAFMLIPLFFAHLLYRTQWEYYWSKIWWVYILTMVSLAIFMMTWSILSALSLQRDLECIDSSQLVHRPPTECYDTSFSSTAFRAVTSVCFLFLACNCAIFGKKILTVRGLEASRYLGPSMEELYKVNLFLFASFLSRGLYECLDVMRVIELPSIPLRGDGDVAFATFFVFMLWDYFPTLLWITVVTGRDVVCSSWPRFRGSSPGEDSPLMNSYTPGVSSDRLSELGRLDSSDELDEETPYFYNADGMQMVVGQYRKGAPARPPERSGQSRSRADKEEAGYVADGTDLLGRRFAAPSSITPVNSWLSPSAEEVPSGSLFRGRSSSGSGNNRSLIYGTFGDDVPSGSAGSATNGPNPLQMYLHSSSSVASSPKMPWPEPMRAPVPALNIPDYRQIPQPSPRCEEAKAAPERPGFSSNYYDNDDALITTPRANAAASPLIRAQHSPARLSVNTSIPPSLNLPTTYNQPSDMAPSTLLEPVPNGHDYLSDIAASFGKGSMWGAQGISPSAAGFPAPPSARGGIRSRSNTAEGSLPPLAPAFPAGELPWRPLPSMNVAKPPLRVATAINLVHRRANEIASPPASPEKKNERSPPVSPLARTRQGSNTSYVSSSPDSSCTPPFSQHSKGARSSASSPAPPPPSEEEWRRHYFTDDMGKYSNSSIVEAGQSPGVEAK